MEAHNVTIPLAFAAGMLSFLSPCVFPLIPSYISFVSGISLEELAADHRPQEMRALILFNSLMFILGFSVVFVAMGATVTLLGQYLFSYREIFRKVGALVIMFLGLHIIGIVNIRALQQDMRFHFSRHKPLGLIGSFMVGVGFAAGWTPCIGPILASILVVAGASDSIGSGVLLLGVYSLGLAAPFFLTSMGITIFLKHFNRFTKQMRVVSILSGAFLIVMGLLLYTNYFSTFTAKLNAWFPFLILN